MVLLIASAKPLGGIGEVGDLCIGLPRRSFMSNHKSLNFYDYDRLLVEP